MIRSFSIYCPPVNRRDIFLRIGQSSELGKANFQSYKKPLLSGPSAKIIRPAVSSVKEFSHFRRFWKRFRYWSFPCGIEEAKRFPHRKNFAPVNLSVSAWQRPVGVLFLLCEFVLPNHLRGFSPCIFLHRLLDNGQKSNILLLPAIERSTADRKWGLFWFT